MNFTTLCKGSFYSKHFFLLMIILILEHLFMEFVFVEENQLLFICLF